MTRLKIVSGGQTGADRAALDVGLALGLDVGGGCPQGRRAEGGRIPARYPLVETPELDYETRTRRNVEESDGTLILNRGKLDGGTALTVAHARQTGQPCLIVALEAGIEPTEFRDWLAVHPITVLNVAGPRASQRPGLCRRTQREERSGWPDSRRVLYCSAAWGPVLGSSGAVRAPSDARAAARPRLFCSGFQPRGETLWTSPAC